MREGRFGLQRLILLIGVPLVAIVGGAIWWLSGGRFVSTENAYVKAHIVQIAPEVSGQVRRVPVRDHATVSAGETLLTIEPRPFRLALDSAEAELEAARTQVETLRATVLGRGLAQPAARLALRRAREVTARAARNARGRRGVVALQLCQDALDRSARRELHDRERDQHDAEQGRDHQQQTAGDIGEHSAPRPSRQAVIRSQPHHPRPIRLARSASNHPVSGAPRS